MAYIRNRAPDPQDCVFCGCGVAASHKEHLVLTRDESVCVALNRYPYNNGHLMVFPLAHGGDFATLPEDIALALMRRVQQTVGVLQAAYECDGVNVGMNLGESAGAGIPNHLHFHVIPRWNGDTGFMPVVADTKVVFEHLHETWAWLGPHFRSQ